MKYHDDEPWTINAAGASEADAEEREYAERVAKYGPCTHETFYEPDCALCNAPGSWSVR